MNRRRFMMIGALAVTVGLLASFLVYRALLVRGSGAPLMTAVVVAARDIPLGTRLQESDLTLAQLPASQLPESIFHTTAGVVGRAAVQTIVRGDLILPNKLATPNSAAGMSVLIPKGMRAVPIRVSDIASVAGFIGPGTRVDVLSTGTPAGSNEPMTTTVLENVEVIATGGQTLRGGEAAQGSPIVTLLVSPDDAQTLTLASSLGRIQLALRNPLDPEKGKPLGTHHLALFLGGAPVTDGAGVSHVPTSKSATAKPKVPKVQTVIVPPYSVETIRGDKRDTTTVPDPK